MIGLALEGGGTKGSYQVGAYYALRHCHIKIDGVCGTSIGAFNSAMIASGQHKDLLKFWQTVDIGNMLDLNDFKDIKITKLAKTFAGLKKILANKGIDLTEMRATLDRTLDVESLYKNKMDFGLVTVRLHDLKPVYKYKNEIPKDQVKDYIIASCYLPVFKMKKIIDDNYYIDGGFYDNRPLNLWLKKDYDTVYVISLNSIGLKPKPIKKSNIITIKPSRKLGGILNLNQEQINDNIRLGYFDTLKVIKKLDGKRFCIKVKSKKYYEFINRRVDKETIRRMKNFYGTDDLKTITLKALEFIMNLEKWTYYKIYSPSQIIKIVKKNPKETNFIYKYVKKLKLL